MVRVNRKRSCGALIYAAARSQEIDLYEWILTTNSPTLESSTRNYLIRIKFSRFKTINVSLPYLLVNSGQTRVLRMCKFNLKDLDVRIEPKPTDLYQGRPMRFWEVDEVQCHWAVCCICSERVKDVNDQKMIIKSTTPGSELRSSTIVMCNSCRYMNPEIKLNALDLAKRKKKKEMIEHLKHLHTDIGQFLVKNDMMHLADIFVQAKLDSVSLIKTGNAIHMALLGITERDCSLMKTSLEYGHVRRSKFVRKVENFAPQALF